MAITITQVAATDKVTLGLVATNLLPTAKSSELAMRQTLNTMNADANAIDLMQLQIVMQEHGTTIQCTSAIAKQVAEACNNVVRNF